MLQIRVTFNDQSILECMTVRDSRAFWRKVSKYCKYMSMRYGTPYRVVKVEKGDTI